MCSGKDIENSRLLERAAEIISTGGVVIVPTETFYGLAADPFQEKAVRRIFLMKSRPEDKPLPLIASERAIVEAIAAEIPPSARLLMDYFWPGSLTILLRPSIPMSGLVTGPGGKIGVRVPPRCAARTLAALSRGWITATSANLSDDPNPSEVRQIAATVLESADLAVDLGPTPGGLPSTLVEPGDEEVLILRTGAIPAAAIEAAVGSLFRVTIK